MLPLISIIIPVYNSEKYLSYCIESVLSQTFRDFELFLINDGSTDSSGEICDEYAQRDKRIKVIHKSNSGVSGARNCALDIATGKYVMFMDADDFWCLDTFLEKIVKFAEEENLDIVRGEYREVTENGTEYRNPCWPKKQLIEYRRLSSSDFLEKAVAGEYFLWLCLIRLDRVRSLRFEANRIYLEDAVFLLQLTQQKLECAYFPIVFYAYRKHAGATTERIGPRQWRETFSFMDTTYHLSAKAKEQAMRNILLKESCVYFIPYLKVISQSPFPFRQKMIWGQEWGIIIQKGRVCSYMRNRFQWGEWVKCSLPLAWLIFYFRSIFVIKMLVKRLLGSKW